MISAGRLKEAKTVLLDGEGMAKIHDEPPRLFQFEFVLGNLAMQQNHVDEAISYYAQAEPPAIASHDDHLIGSVDLKLAKAYQTRKQTDKALDYYERSLTVLAKLTDVKFPIANALYDRGNTYVDALQLDKAAADFTRALGLFQELKSKVWIAGSLTRLGYVSYGQGHLDQAEGYYTRSLAAWQEIGAKPQIANSEYYLGIVLRHEGKLDQALAMQQNALAILQALNPANQDTVGCLTDLGAICGDRKEWELSADYYNQALKIDLTLNDRPGTIRLYKALGEAYTQSNQSDKAKDAFAKADELTRAASPTPPPPVPPSAAGQ